MPGVCIQNSRNIVRRAQLSSILWTAEIAVGILPVTVTLILGLVPYLVVMLVLPTAIYHWDTEILCTLTALSAAMFGGALGIAAILTARRPDKLRNRPKSMIRAGLFALAGLCGESVYFALMGTKDLASDARINFIALWVFVGPLIIGAHITWRVLASRRTPLDSN